MIIKVGNKIIDSGKEMVCIIFSEEEIKSIKEFPDGHDMFNSHPSNTKKEDIKKFNEMFLDAISTKKEKGKPFFSFKNPFSKKK